MKSAIIVLALLITGCGEQAVEKRPEQSESWVEIFADSMAYYYENQIDSTGAFWSACSLAVMPNYQEVVNFAAWCQKAYPEVWREYHATEREGTHE